MQLATEPDFDSDAQVNGPLIADRESFIEEKCVAARKIAHLGCTDSPYTEWRLSTGRLLHERLIRVGSVVGFDIDKAALDYLSDRFPKSDFVCADVSKPLPPCYHGQFDLVVAGEVVEHVPHPVDFLAGAHQLLSDNGVLLVTVPNACSPKIGVRTLVGREKVHPDHCAYYSPRTLRHTLELAGYRTELVASYLASPGRVGRYVNGVLMLVHRATHGPVGDGIVALARRS